PRPRVAALNGEQQAALAAVLARLPPAGAPGVVLLHGVTGSGKTAVYLEAIAAALAGDRTALMLVPEIGLTPALFADFMDAFPEQVSVLHSGLSPAARAQHWHRARRGQSAVVIGTRSAVFAPLPRLGLIIVDEEHDGAYKQQESPRYHARDLAVLRGRLAGAAVVLGSATPSLESYENARRGKYALARLRARVESRPLPAMRMVDMCAAFRAQAAEKRQRGQPRRDPPAAPLSAELIAALGACFERGGQAVVLINRRGYAPAVVCRACGQAVSCRDCSLSLTYHKRQARLLCHACGFALAVPETCPACGSEHLYFMGAGSEKIEEALAGLFPRARIARLDRDTARERRHFSRVLAEFRAGAYDLLVGTQMIAKGHDLPGVTLVGVLQADWGLTIPDFRAAERTYQLLTQVAGRAGRGTAPGEVVLQLMHPEHYAVQAALQGDAELFYEPEARYRRMLHYPPFAALALARVRHRDYEQARRWTEEVGRFLEQRQAAHPEVRVVGPAPSPVPRLKAEHRFQFLLKSPRRQPLAALLSALRHYAAARLPAAVLALDVDPQGWD
ncbi:MAG: replication restart helicase PriA, partial [Terriglobales bacterium]